MDKLIDRAKKHLHFLCEELDDRSVGSRGNLASSLYFKKILEENNWQTISQRFEAIDWLDKGATIDIDSTTFAATPSPYSNPCNVDKAPVAIISTVDQLKPDGSKGKVLILKGELCKEQLMPKNFVFYNPDHHKQIIHSLEQSGACALIFIVEQSGFYEGGIYPFPIIEDGDFEIPSVFISEAVGEKLLAHKPKTVSLISDTRKIPSKGYNVIGRKGRLNKKKIVITAHIDAKQGSPGAIDNATGVTVLLLLSNLLKEFNGEEFQLELIALNGEDYFSVPGQMTYLKARSNDFSDVILNINIDGAGFSKGKTAYAMMELSHGVEKSVEAVFNQFSGLTSGKPWVQGDHSMFLQFGVPAIAISSDWLIENAFTQQITHTKNDTLDIVDVSKLTELTYAINELINQIKTEL